MKINKFLLGAFALSMTFASCSNDEPAKGEGSGNVNDGEKYVAVTIKSVGDFGSRAAGEGFEEGVGNENNITAENLRFYFFLKDGRPFVMNSTGVNGTVSNTNMVAPTKIAYVHPDSNNPNITDGEATELRGVLVLGTPAEGYKGNEPAYVICVANPVSTLSFTDFADKSMEQLLSIEANATFSLTAASDFMMTSSSYYDGNTKTYFTDLAGKIKTTPDEAEKNPADIFLERLASKVRAKGLKEWTVQKKNEDGSLTARKFNIDVIGADGNVTTSKDVELKVELTGWRLINYASSNYSIKNLQDSWLTTQPFADWNDASKHRSYWTSPSSVSDNDIVQGAFKLGIKEGDVTDCIYGNYDDTTDETKQKNVVYCYENTIQPTSISDRETKATAIVVRGVVKMDGKAVKLCKWGGQYYTEEALQSIIIESYNKDANNADKLTAADVQFNKDNSKPNTYYAFVMRNGHEYNGNMRFSKIERWVDGITSYVTNIKHAVNKYGVVRNHIYDYEFTNVVGLGVPGEEPDNPKPETETYLAARVHVLNWHVISNSVVLE